MNEKQINLKSLKKLSDIGSSFIKQANDAQRDGKLSEVSFEDQYKELSSLNTEESFFLGLSIAIFSIESDTGLELEYAPSVEATYAIMDDVCSRVCIEDEYKGILN